MLSLHIGICVFMPALDKYCFQLMWGIWSLCGFALILQTKELIIRGVILLMNDKLLNYFKLRVVHVPVMPITFSSPPRVSDPDMHHDTCVVHVSWCMPESQTSGSIWSRWRAKRSRHSRRMRTPQFYVSGKSPMARDLKRPATRPYRQMV